MAKKIVRGITEVKTINNQDFDTNNVNDLLSDGEHNYIHRKKKDGSEEYHNLTNNIKTLETTSDLVTITNYNNSTNKAKIEVAHDDTKEQRLSTDQHLTLTPAENATSDKTNIKFSDNFLSNNVAQIEVTKWLKKQQSPLTNVNGKIYGNQVIISLDDTFVNNVITNTQDINTLKSDAITNITSDTPLIEFTKDGNNVELNGTGLINLVNTKQNKLTAGEGIIIQGGTISATNGLTPQHIAYGTRGKSYYAFREVFGQRTTYTIEVVQGEPELTVTGELKTMLTQELSTVKTVTNGAITLTYDDTDVKIITNTSPSNGVEQATFTFFHQ